MKVESKHDPNSLYTRSKCISQNKWLAGEIQALLGRELLERAGLPAQETNTKIGGQRPEGLEQVRWCQ